MDSNTDCGPRLEVQMQGTTLLAHCLSLGFSGILRFRAFISFYKKIYFFLFMSVHLYVCMCTCVCIRRAQKRAFNFQKLDSQAVGSHLGWVLGTEIITFHP